MKVKYQGPLQAVRVPALDAIVEQGKAVDAPEDVAASLIAQGWAEVKPPTKKAPAKKASATTKKEEG